MHDNASPIQLVDMRAAAVDQHNMHFDHHQFYGYLPQQSELGSTLLTANQLQSTQTLLQQNTAIIPDNTVCIAYQQIGGKGDNELFRSLAQQNTPTGKADNVMCSRQRGQHMGITCWMPDVFFVQESKHHR